MNNLDVFRGEPTMWNAFDVGAIKPTDGCWSQFVDAHSGSLIRNILKHFDTYRYI